MWAMQYLLCDRPRTFISSGGLGTMGYGIPAAVGAKAARPDATVVCVDGDGCFQMTAQELATVGARGAADRRRHRQQRLPRHGATVAGHVLRGALLADPPDAALPDYAALARAYGALGFTVDSPDDLDAALKEALDVAAGRRRRRRVDPREHCFPMIPAGAAALDVMEYPGDEETVVGMKHTLAVLVENKPGALTRITTMFARRGFNIESLAVGADRAPRRLADHAARRLRAALLEQIEKQMHKLVNVLRVRSSRRASPSSASWR